MDVEPLIPKNGGYRKLKSFQLAQLCYDLTERFCERYIPKRSRTQDQMVQAARSGVQNIAEGSKASGTSKKTELKLTNVARSSLEELRLDYEDFLRHRQLPQWLRDDPRRTQLVARRCTSAEAVAEWIREVHEAGRAGRAGRAGGDGRNGRSGQSGHNGPAENGRSTYPEIAANAILVLIEVACYLLDRQLASLAAAFAKDGGFTERLYRIRSERRKNSPPS